MYSKKLLRFYIDKHLQRKGSNYRSLAKELGITHSNLSRALDDDPKHNLTLPQFAHLVQYLELDDSHVFHILTGKKGKEAAASLIESLSRQLVEQLSGKNGDNTFVNTRRKKHIKITVPKR